MDKEADNRKVRQREIKKLNKTSDLRNEHLCTFKTGDDRDCLWCRFLYIEAIVQGIIEKKRSERE